MEVRFRWLSSRQNRRSMRKKLEAYFEIYDNDSGKWHWRLRASNGMILAISAYGYSSRGAVRTACHATVAACVFMPKIKLSPYLRKSKQGYLAILTDL